jgi:hypothetical protein
MFPVPARRDRDRGPRSPLISAGRQGQHRLVRVRLTQETSIPPDRRLGPLDLSLGSGRRLMAPGRSPGPGGDRWT